MGRSEKTKETERQAEAGTSSVSGTSAAERPKRGRKPKAYRKQTETGTVSGKAGEAGPTDIPETGAVPVAAAEGGTEVSAGTAPEDDTAKGAAPEAENAREEAVDPGRETMADTESGQDKAAEAVPAPLPAVPASGQMAGTPLKRMRQEFQQRSQVIREQMRDIQNAFITIGFQLHWIRENNMFRVLNYKNIYEYAEKEYGIRKTTCVNFISIIENYAERDGNGEVIESIADCYRNYSASQLVAMLGLTDEMKQQVTPDMSVRAINRLRKGEPEVPAVLEASPAMLEGPVPVSKETEMPSDGKAPEPDNEEHAEEEPETAGMPEADRHAGEDREMPAGNTVTGELPAAMDAAEAGPEDTGNPETETAADSVKTGRPGETGHAGGDTLAEIDSYSDYQSMADELDLIMRHVFSAGAAVRVRIVCVQG